MIVRRFISSENSAIRYVRCVGDTFSFCGQAFNGSIPEGAVLLVFDTNVVSAIAEVCKNGFDDSKVRHRRVLHLAEWMASRPESRAFAWFGVVEGAGFHAGGISARNFLSRSITISGFLRWAATMPDELSGGDPMPDSVLEMPSFETHSVVLELLDWLLPSTALTGYFTALAIARADQQKLTPLERARWALGRIADDLDFVPTAALFPVLLTFCGHPQVANKLRTGVFKLDGKDLRKGLLSAGWDLGYLQLMSLARAPEAAPLFGELAPVLVTEEQRLPELAALITAEGNTGSFEIDHSIFNPAFADEAFDLAREHVTQRMLADVRAPSWEGLGSAASKLEAELSLPDTPALRLLPPTRQVTAAAEEVQAFWNALRLADRPQAVNRLTEAEGDCLLGALAVLTPLLHNNAGARGHATEATWEMIAGNLPPGSTETAPVRLAVLLLDAHDKGDAMRFNGGLELLQSNRKMYGFVLFACWQIGRIVIEDTATARSTTTTALTEDIDHQINELGLPHR